MVEGQRLQEGLRREPGPAPEQVMQFGRRDARSFRDGVDIRLFAPIAADMGDGAPDHVVVIGRTGKFRGVGIAVGGQHGRPRRRHHLASR